MSFSTITASVKLFSEFHCHIVLRLEFCYNDLLLLGLMIFFYQVPLYEYLSLLVTSNSF